MSSFSHNIRSSAPQSLEMFGPGSVDLARLRESKNPAGSEAELDYLPENEDIFADSDLPEIEKYLRHTQAQNREEVTLTILHTNDLHGNLMPVSEAGSEKQLQMGGAAQATTIIDIEREISRRRGEEFLLLDAGDMSMGTPVAGHFKGISVIDVMNHQKYDAATIGNHEFDWGMEPLKNMVQEARFPFISANIKEADGKPLLDLKPYIIKDMGKAKVGIIGLTTDETAGISSSEDAKKLTFEDPIKTLEEQLPNMKNEGADIIIVLSHLGHSKDLELAEKVPGLDLIVGGHSHTHLDSPVRVGDTAIVQTGANGQNIGRVSLKWSPSQKAVTEIEGRLIPIDAGKVAPDYGIQKIVNRYMNQIESLMNQKLGEIGEDLLTSEDGQESGLGNLVTDMMRKSTGAEIALLNSGSVRSNLLKGEVLYRDVYNVIPFDSRIVTLRMQGNDILKTLEESAGRGRDKTLQLSGLSVVYDSQRPPGHRLVDVKLEDGTPLDAEAYYTVAATDFLAKGGDHYNAFTNGQLLDENGEVLQKEVAGTLKASQVLYSPPVGRMSDIGFAR